MKVYIAAPYEERAEAIRVMQVLEALGVEVTSDWLRDGGQDAPGDLSDVDRADTVLLLNPAAYRDRGTGGRHVEMGYALALGKQVVLLGARSNIFHDLEAVRVIGNLEEMPWR